MINVSSHPKKFPGEGFGGIIIKSAMRSLEKDIHREREGGRENILYNRQLSPTQPFAL